MLLIGADSPQITQPILESAVRRLAHDASGPLFVLGRSHDGGFYLFGGRTPIPGDLWQDVPYSTGTTAEALACRVGSLAMIYELPPLSDVDVSADLESMAVALESMASRLPEHSALLQWLRRVLHESPHDHSAG